MPSVHRVAESTIQVVEGLASHNREARTRIRVRIVAMLAIQGVLLPGGSPLSGSSTSASICVAVAVFVVGV